MFASLWDQVERYFQHRRLDSIQNWCCFEEALCPLSIHSAAKANVGCPIHWPVIPEYEACPPTRLCCLEPPPVGLINDRSIDAFANLQLRAHWTVFSADWVRSSITQENSQGWLSIHWDSCQQSPVGWFLCLRHHLGSTTSPTLVRITPTFDRAASLVTSHRSVLSISTVDSTPACTGLVRIPLETIQHETSSVAHFLEEATQVRCSIHTPCSWGLKLAASLCWSARPVVAAPRGVHIRKAGCQLLCPSHNSASEATRSILWAPAHCCFLRRSIPLSDLHCFHSEHCYRRRLIWPIRFRFRSVLLILRSQPSPRYLSVLSGEHCFPLSTEKQYFLRYSPSPLFCFYSFIEIWQVEGLRIVFPNRWLMLGSVSILSQWLRC